MMCNIKIQVFFWLYLHASLIYGPRHEKTTFCRCENKGVDQLPGYQRLCFHYKDSTTPFLHTEISSL